jgi:hemolysin activation/secretion protein
LGNFIEVPHLKHLVTNMLTSNLGGKLSLNYFSRVNLAASSLLLAIALSLLRLQPLAAQVSTKSGEQTISTPNNQVSQRIVVKNFEVVGSTIFTQTELNQALKSYLNRPLTLAELFQARSTITKLYTDQGYVSSGAYLPPQELNDGTVQIAVLEGKFEEINVLGTKNLSKDYITDRLETATVTPINVDSLLSALQLLRLDPLIANLSAELSAGISPGTSVLDITIQEADVFNVAINLNNSRSPSVGTNQRSIGINHGNLLGFGDRLNLKYANTKGSNGLDLAYAVPVNSKNGTINAFVGVNSNNVIEDPFTAIDLESKSRYYELSFRQPILLKPTQEFALGISLTRSESETFLMNDRFFLSRGANDEGETKISAVRLFQEFVKRNDQAVLALRSQFSLGVDALNSTINDDDGEPDSTFVSWRGQSQWTRRLDEDFLLLLRGDVQLSAGSLVALEQFRIGGVKSIRGYRQDLSLGDHGLFASAELRIPILRFQKFDGLLQVTPFFDVGTVWNTDDLEIANTTLASLGLGLNLALGEKFNARLDWGIPLVDLETKGSSLQEDGIHFFVDYSFF